MRGSYCLGDALTWCSLNVRAWPGRTDFTAKASLRGRHFPELRRCLRRASAIAGRERVCDAQKVIARERPPRFEARAGPISSTPTRNCGTAAGGNDRRAVLRARPITQILRRVRLRVQNRVDTPNVKSCAPLVEYRVRLPAAGPTSEKPYCATPMREYCASSQMRSAAHARTASRLHRFVCSG